MLEQIFTLFLQGDFHLPPFAGWVLGLRDVKRLAQDHTSGEDKPT